MPKFYGKIGFAETIETSPSVYEEIITEKSYSITINKNTRRLDQTSNKLNHDINISNSFSIVANPYATRNFHSMRYVVWMGTKWNITNIDASSPPRLLFEVSGIYNDADANS